MYLQTSEQEVLSLGFGNYSCNWGVHICGLYETEAERDQILMGFFHAGDEAGDLQLYCPVERTQDDFKQKYSALYPSCSCHLNQPDRFQLLSTKALYYPTGIFSPWDMQDNLEAFYEHSQKQGKQNIRASAEMVWALESVPGVEHLMAYESRLNYFIEGKPWISICLYNLTKFSGSQIMNVLQTHPYTISGGVITENPYYMNPDDYLRKNAPQFLPGNRQSA